MIYHYYSLLSEQDETRRATRATNDLSYRTEIGAPHGGARRPLGVVSPEPPGNGVHAERDLIPVRPSKPDYKLIIISLAGLPTIKSPSAS